jgi:2-polyprenyl-3-methyl-5-hydroxy-6-metoxy-1,4-benzoquinol methylase
MIGIPTHDKASSSKVQSFDRGNTPSRHNQSAQKRLAMNDPAQLFNDGKAYERMMGRRSKLVGAIFLEWLAPTKNLRWVEVGCGNGAFTEELIARCAPLEVAAIDPASDKERLKSRLREQLPIDRDRRISYEAFANAIKGRTSA